jgi:carbamoyltransferase
MITLGINAAFHDSSAALVRDGHVVAASEEERFTRIKHAKRPVPFSAWELPFHAIDDCLRQAGVDLRSVDHVAYSFDPYRFMGPHDAGAFIRLPLEPSAQPAKEGKGVWDPLFASYIVNAPRQLASGAPHHLRQRFRGARPDGPYRLHFVDHHLSHQASAFLASPFSQCAVMTLDGRGEESSTTYGVYFDGKYEALGDVRVPHSLGLLYERVTQHLGFLQSSDEYKVMALAALGDPARYRGMLSECIRICQAGRYEVAPLDLAACFGPARERGQPLERHHFDLAAALQAVLEETVLELAAWLRSASGQPLLAMAGGVALNCVMNSRLRDSALFDQVWVQPAAGDAGTALGAALWVDSRMRSATTRTQPALPPTRAAAHFDGGPLALAPRRWVMSDAYLGPCYCDDEIECQLRWSKLPYLRLTDIPGTAARLLARGKVLGWFQGRMEFGPRALGARSILASPLDAAMQARINELKDREDFRPVAPAVPQERLADWFRPAAANGGEAPFMLFIYDVHESQARRIPAACHQDLTARVQTVSADANPLFHAVLERFGQMTGVPVLINTSFNVRGEPIVCSPKDALNAFWSTPLDALVIGSFLLEKPSASPAGGGA